MGDSAVAIWDQLQEASADVRLHKQGKITLRTAEELLDEL